MEIKNKIQNTIAEKLRCLPEDIIEEILSWLPVKSLSKFRCVSKSWRNLIGSKEFIKTHLENSSTTTNVKRHGIVTSTSRPNHYHSLKYCSLHSLLYKQSIHTVDFDYPIINRNCSVRVVGSCNGLVCLLINKEKFILWNPSTRKSRKLPDVLDADQFMNPEFDFYVDKYGFGFAESEDDYKVLGVLLVNRRTGIPERITKLYSLKSNSWKRIEHCYTCVTVDDSGTFANGKLYWGRGPFVNIYGHEMDFFDLDNEVYGKTKYPYQRFDMDAFYTTLGVLGRYLCVFCHFFGVKGDAWILKQESWSKVFSISYIDCPRQDIFDTQFCMGVNGEIIMSQGSTFIVYKLKDQLYKLREISYSCAFEEMNTYIESLVLV